MKTNTRNIYRLPIKYILNPDDDSDNDYQQLNHDSLVTLKTRVRITRMNHPQIQMMIILIMHSRLKMSIKYSRLKLILKI